MTRHKTLLVLLVLVPFLWGAGGGRSSKIPDRREFPVNPSINPCTDFYGYACSKVADSFKLREDRSRHIFAFSDSGERLLEAKKEFLADLASKKDPSKLPERSRELRDVYVACLNEKVAAQEERAIVAEWKKKILAIPTREAFLKFLSTRIDSVDFSFVQFGTTSNLDNSDWEDVYLLGGLQSLPERSYYDRPEVVGDFRKLAQAFFEAIGVDRPEQRANWVVDVEKQFSRTFPLPAEFRELFNKKTSITRAQLAGNYPEFQLQAFLKRIPNRTAFRHVSPQNFEYLRKLMREEPLDALKSVYLYHQLPEYMDDAYPDFYQKAFDFRRKHLGGPNERPDRKERCTTLVMNNFTKELDAELLPKIFPDFPEEKFIALAESVRASILEGLEKNRWLTPQTKTKAIEKIKRAKLQLVKPRNEREWDFNLKADYSDKAHYANVRLNREKVIEKEIDELVKKRDKTRWAMGPLTVNAYYSPSDNKFVMPIGILQYPFYDPKISTIANLGAVGVVIGHELGHGIDDKGSRYDSEGSLTNWMTQKDLEQFRKRGSKMIAQFEKAGHNGELTLGENIGDLVGVTFAYAAAFPKGRGTKEQKQEFFTQYARLWCGVIRPKMRERLLKTDPHALFDARVNEQVKHQPGFQEAFGCKASDPMVLSPEKRVTIW